MKKKILITGGNGVLGRAFKKFMSIYPEKEIYDTYFDISNYDSLKSVISSFKPDYFFNFAGISNSGEKDFGKLMDVNVTAVYNQLSLIKEYCPECKYVNIGSILELNNPEKPYAISKKFARDIVNSFKKDIFAIQPYLGNTTYYDQSSDFVIGKLINGLKKIKYNIDNGLEVEPIVFKSNSKFSFMWAEDVICQIFNLIDRQEKVDYIIKNDNDLYLKDITEMAAKTIFKEKLDWFTYYYQGHSIDYSFMSSNQLRLWDKNNLFKTICSIPMGSIWDFSSKTLIDNNFTIPKIIVKSDYSEIFEKLLKTS